MSLKEIRNQFGYISKLDVVECIADVKGDLEFFYRDLREFEDTYLSNGKSFSVGNEVLYERRFKQQKISCYQDFLVVLERLLL